MLKVLLMVWLKLYEFLITNVYKQQYNIIFSMVFYTINIINSIEYIPYISIIFCILLPMKYKKILPGTLQIWFRKGMTYIIGSGMFFTTPFGQGYRGIYCPPPPLFLQGLFLQSLKIIISIWFEQVKWNSFTTPTHFKWCSILL